MVPLASRPPTARRSRPPAPPSVETSAAPDRGNPVQRHPLRGRRSPDRGNPVQRHPLRGRRTPDRGNDHPSPDRRNATIPTVHHKIWCQVSTRPQNVGVLDIGTARCR
jgi:hypothetical protein